MRERLFEYRIFSISLSKQESNDAWEKFHDFAKDGFRYKDKVTLSKYIVFIFEREWFPPDEKQDPIGNALESVTGETRELFDRVLNRKR